MRQMPFTLQQNAGDAYKLGISSLKGEGRKVIESMLQLHLSFTTATKILKHKGWYTSRAPALWHLEMPCKVYENKIYFLS